MSIEYCSDMGSVPGLKGG